MGFRCFKWPVGEGGPRFLKTINMRDVSTITVPEGIALWEAVMPEKYKFINGHACIFEETDKLPKRVVFHSGVERLGIYFTGKVWADSDLIYLELDQKKVSDFLNSIGIFYSLVDVA